jgi:hypothetical protein
MSSEDIRLEGFAEPLRGKKLYCIGATESNTQVLLRSCISTLDIEVAHRGRKVLFIQEGCSAINWLLRMKWDAIFHLRDNQDIRLALTYIMNAAKPVRFVWAGGEPPAAVFHYLSKHDAISFIGFGVNYPKSTEWDAIFWKGMEAEQIEPLLQSRIGIQMTEKSHLKTVLRELKASDLSLVWSSIGESDKSGSLYWHDPSESIQASTYSPEEAADILRMIADSLSRSTYGKV